ncbi:MAG: hypothetical protein IK024_05550 [Treponema sp.]|nr:hypothetical protein [Treponema sp.]
MKSTITKSLAAAAILLAVGITPVFAKGNANAKNNSNNQQQSQQNQLNQKSAKSDATGRAGKNAGGKHGGKMLSNPDVMGTVTAVSEKDSTVTIKDADGKETVIHVNPLTRITKILTAEEKQALKSADTTNTTTTEKAAALTISDIKKGDWIAVAKMETETKVLEAKQIAIQVK